MGSQSGYFCVTIYAAAAFIENLTSEQLAIDHDFFRSQFSPNSTLDDTLPLADDSDLIDGTLPEVKTLEQYMQEALPTEEPLNHGDSVINFLAPTPIPETAKIASPKIPVLPSSPLPDDSTLLDKSLSGQTLFHAKHSIETNYK